MRLEKSQTNATNVTMPLLMHSVWGDIWKCTPEKSHTNATNVTMPLFMQAIRGDILKCTLKKSQKMQPMRLCLLSSRQFEATFENVQCRKIGQMQLVWLCILPVMPFENTFEKKHTGEKPKNVTCATLHPSMQTIWPDIWIDTVEKSQKCNHNEYEKLKKCYLCDFAFSRSCQLGRHLANILEKSQTIVRSVT